MADTIVERLITQLVFDGDVAQFERAESAVSGLSAAAFAAAAAMAAMAASTAAEINVYRRLASGLDMTTQGARETAAVFRTTGAEINDVSDALQTLSDYSLEAMKGNETWTETFKQIGVSAKDLKGKKPDELLMVVADGFAQTADSVTRAATASQLFGDDVGRKLLPLLIRGAKGIQYLKDEARMFGGVLTEEDSIAAENLTFDLRRLGYMMDGLRMRIGLALMPVLQDLVAETLDWVAANKDWLNLKIEQGINVLTSAFQALTSPLGLVVVGFGGLVAAKGAATAVGSLATALGFSAGGLGGAVAGLTAAAVLPALVALVGQDLYFAMQGLPSVAGDVAESFGAQSELQLALLGLRDLLGSVVGFAQALGPVFTDSINAIAEKLPDLSWITDMLPDAPPGGWMAGFGSLTERASGGFNRATEALQGPNRDLATEAIAMSIEDAILNPFGITGIERPKEEFYSRIPRGADGGINGYGTSNVSIVVNANGVNAAEAEGIARGVIQSEISELYDTSNGGVR